MKLVLMIAGAILAVAGIFCIPAGIGVFVYDWAINDVELKLALWKGVMTWLSMLAISALGGILWLAGTCLK